MDLAGCLAPNQVQDKGTPGKAHLRDTAHAFVEANFLGS